MRWPLLLTLLIAPVAMAETQPLKTSSRVPIGLSEANKIFVSIDENTVGRQTIYRPVAYHAPKWRKARLKGTRSFRVDLRDEETLAKSKERNGEIRARVDEAFRAHGISEVRASAGGFTGRVRLMDLGMVIVLEDNTVFARTGDASVMKSTPIIKRVHKLVKNCKGTVETKLLHVAARQDWKVAAIRVEATCVPRDEDGVAKRVRRLFVQDLSKVNGQ